MAQNYDTTIYSEQGTTDHYFWHILAHILVLSCMGAIVYGTTLVPLLALLVMLWFLPSAMALVMLGLRNDPSLSITIFLFNVGCIMFYIIPLFHQNEQIHSLASQMFNNPKSWIIVYLVSAFGWMIHYILPRLIAEIILCRIENKIKRLRNCIAHLEGEWDLR